MGFSPLLSTGEALSGVLCSALGSPLQEVHGHAGASPARAVKLIKASEQFLPRESLKELDLFSLEKAWLGGLWGWGGVYQIATHMHVLNT